MPEVDHLEFLPTPEGDSVFENAIMKITLRRNGRVGSFAAEFHIKGSEIHFDEHKNVAEWAAEVAATLLTQSADAKAEEIALQQHRFTPERIQRFRELEKLWREEARRLRG